MLWLALFLPEFPLQARLAGLPVPSSATDAPTVIYRRNRGRAQIHSLDASAQRAGIEPGMTLAAAQALCANLQTFEHDPDQEASALQRLAQWAQQFTPVVSLQPPDGLLLEIEASLNLFHGLPALQKRVAAALQPLGYQARQGVAPTPGGAWLLARHGPSPPITDLPTLRALLPQRPIEHLSLDAEQRQTLRALGIQTLGDCLQLPRQALGQRLGLPLLRQIDRILGHLPDPRQPYAAPATFQRQLLLPATVQDTEPLLFLLQRLLHELAGFLRARQSGAQRLKLDLIAPQQPVETLTLNLLAPDNDPEQLFKLWRERLERHRLNAPVEGIALHADLIQPLSNDPPDLFAPRHGDNASFTRFLERLRNRLGENSLRQLHLHDDHRAEHASRLRRWQPSSRSRAPAPTASSPHRPTWLLQPPQPLRSTARGPWLHGPLTLLDGPERIESGWWDDGDQRRDYYIARSQRQQTLWIFREVRPPHRWFLHGWFS